MIAFRNRPMHFFDVVFLILFFAGFVTGVVGSPWGWWGGAGCLILAIALYPMLLRGYVG